MANRTLSILLKKIHKTGDIDTIFLRNRAKDVVVDEATNTTLDTVIEKIDDISDGANKTEKSSTNGNIKVDNEELNVYKHPESGAKPGSYNKVTVDKNGHVTAGETVNDWSGSVSGDISNAETTFETPTGRTLPETGENNATVFGKIAKWLTDLKALAFVEKVGTTNLDTTLTTFYNKRLTTDNVTTSTAITAAGWIADARAIASLQNQINTINSNLNENLIESALIVPEKGSVINLAKTKLGKNGVCFLTISTATDVPEDFTYCSGIIVHRTDTMSIILFDRHYGRITVNSLESTNLNRWTGWKIYITNSDLTAHYPKVLFFNIEDNSYKIIKEQGTARFSQLVFLQAANSKGHGLYLLSGYGSDGGTIRYNISEIASGSQYNIEIINGTNFKITNSNNSTATVALAMFMGDNPIIE